MRPLIRATTLCLLAASAAAPAAAWAAEPLPAQPWELVGQSGWVRMVYVDPARIKDTKLIAEIVRDVMGGADTSHPLQIDFFDDRSLTPTTKPYQTPQRLHQRAKFNFNPANGMRRFVRIDLVPVDPNQPARVKQVETEETLPSP